MTDRDTLQNAFLEDHRVVTRGLYDLQQAVDRDDLDTARRLAAELDRVAGPHMDFEQRYFYPMLVDVLGADFVEELYAEHRSGQRAVAALCSIQDNSAIDREELQDCLNVAMNHVLSCGSMTSHLASMTPEQQLQLRQQLDATRREGRRWTELNKETR